MHPIFFILLATLCEVIGDAIIRMGIYNHAGAIRVGLMLMGAVLLFGYGFILNLAPMQFGQVVGLYIATLFIVWQITNFIAFKTLPNVPVIVGGILIIAGGAIVAFWKTE